LVSVVVSQELCVSHCSASWASSLQEVVIRRERLKRAVRRFFISFIRICTQKSDPLRILYKFLPVPVCIELDNKNI